jgi:TonB family protein
VQTGGFGDPNGIPANDAKGSAKSIAKASGMFDLPVGGGYGNGSGGTNGVRGTVASSGFGNGVAVQPGDRNQNRGKVQATTFTAAPPPAPDASARKQAAPEQPSSVPVSIQSKPTPVYTAEARQLQIEGEVLLNVVFTAQGQVQIVNVVRGLGHGLDEAAQRAARGVKFTPAQRNGHPVDSTAVLHIVFQLS